MINTDNNKLLDPISMPNDAKGKPIAPNGVVAIHRTGSDGEDDQPGTLVVGGADSTAIFIDLAPPLAPPVAVPTGGKPDPATGVVGRADELAYDPRNHIILIANDRDQDLFVTSISTVSPPMFWEKSSTTAASPEIPNPRAALNSQCGMARPKSSTSRSPRQ